MTFIGNPARTVDKLEVLLGGLSSCVEPVEPRQSISLWHWRMQKGLSWLMNAAGKPIRARYIHLRFVRSSRSAKQSFDRFTSSPPPPLPPPAFLFLSPLLFRSSSFFLFLFFLLFLSLVSFWLIREQLVIPRSDDYGDLMKVFIPLLD